MVDDDKRVCTSDQGLNDDEQEDGKEERQGGPDTKLDSRDEQNGRRQSKANR